MITISNPAELKMASSPPDRTPPKDISEPSQAKEDPLPTSNQRPTSFPAPRQPQPVRFQICNLQAHILMSKMTFLLVLVSFVGCVNAIMVSEARQRDSLHVKVFTLSVAVVNTGAVCIVAGRKWESHLPTLASTCYCTFLILVWAYAVVLGLYARRLCSRREKPF